MIGFFSFTEVTDPAAHQAYNEWHQLDHMPEQFSLDGIIFGQRWVCTPECVRSRVAVAPLLERCHYMTLYLMRDDGVLPGFFALARQLRQADRFFAERRSHLSGPFEITDRAAAARVRVSAAAVPFRPSNGVYVVVGPAVDVGAMTAIGGVAGAWAFSDGERGRHITVAFVDGDVTSTALVLGQLFREGGPTTEWAGALECVDPGQWNWFDRLTP